jgi:hypothetical protein
MGTARRRRVVEGSGTALFDYAEHDRLDVAKHFNSWNAQGPSSRFAKPGVPLLVATGSSPRSCTSPSTSIASRAASQ